MFEDDDDTGLDLDDEFLNVVFQPEEGQNINKFIGNGTTTINSGELNRQTPSSFQALIKNNPPNAHESFWTRNDSSSSSTGNIFPQISPVNRIHQLGPGNINVGDKENKRKGSPLPSRSKRERKFPGPAGLLPERKSSRSTPLKLESVLEVESPSVSIPDELCSQGRLSGSVLEDGPWQSLMSDLGPHADLLDVVNVASVKRKAATRCFVNRKVPFLAAVLHHLDVSSADPCIILRDSTGEIHGTLHRDVWQQFAAELVIGSVLVIRNVGLLSTGISSRRHYLNITANNLATIYSANPEREQKRVLHSLSPQDYSQTIQHWKSLVIPQRTTDSPSSSLFGNTSLPSSASSSPDPRLHMNKVQPHVNVPRHPPHVPNVRQTSKNMQDSNNLYRRPQNSTPVLPPRPMGKNLFPSSSTSQHQNQNPVCAIRSNANLYSPSTTRPLSGVANQTNTGRNVYNNSFTPNSVQKSTTTNVQQMPSKLNSFKYDFEMLNSKQNTSGACPPDNCRRDQFRDNCENSARNASPRIILSQSSQLTVEEQSVIDSVFDGIDADSLFDDDF